MKPFLRFLAIFQFVLWLMFLGIGQTQAFAGLTVTAYGDEIYDISTGITTLPEGGEVVDLDSNITLSASEVRYQQGVFVEAFAVSLEGEFVSLTAASIYLDIEAKVLRASGEVDFSSGDVTGQTDALYVYLADNIAVAVGSVKGESPALEAQTLIIDTTTQTSLLLAPYNYQDGPFTLRGSAEGEMLSLFWTNDGAATDFQASSEVDEDLKQRLLAYLP